MTDFVIGFVIGGLSMGIFGAYIAANPHLWWPRR